MSGSDAVLSIEICSGPLDGTGSQVTGGSFKVGHDGGCDVLLPEGAGTPAAAVVRVAAADAGLTLESECDLEYEGATARTAAGAPPLIVRIGATDLAVSIAESTARLEEPSASQAAAGGKKKCAICGWDNAAGAKWCSNCGRDF